jgi:hypothetical protein
LKNAHLQKLATIDQSNLCFLRSSSLNRIFLCQVPSAARKQTLLSWMSLGKVVQIEGHGGLEGQWELLPLLHLLLQTSADQPGHLGHEIQGQECWV